jgi:hypothetical protein
MIISSIGVIAGKLRTMRLIGRKGTITVLDGGRLLIIPKMGNQKIVPGDELAKYIKELEIIGTEDGSLSLGEW